MYEQVYFHDQDWICRKIIVQNFELQRTTAMIVTMNNSITEQSLPDTANITIVLTPTKYVCVQSVAFTQK